MRPPGFVIDSWEEPISQGLKPVFLCGLNVRAKARTYLRGNSKGKGRSRFPSGMTTKRATTTASPGSTGVAEAGADAVDRGGDGAVEFFGFVALAFAAHELYLDEAHGVDVGVS